MNNIANCPLCFNENKNIKLIPKKIKLIQLGKVCILKCPKCGYNTDTVKIDYINGVRKETIIRTQKIAYQEFYRKMHELKKKEVLIKST